MRSALSMSVLLAVACGGSGADPIGPGSSGDTNQVASLTVVLALEGNGGDQDGVVVSVSAGGAYSASRATDLPGTIVFEDVPVGAAQVQLTGVAPHCLSDSVAQTVNVVVPSSTYQAVVNCVGDFAYLHRVSSTEWVVRYLDETGGDQVLQSGGRNVLGPWSPSGARMLSTRWVGSQCEVYTIGPSLEAMQLRSDSVSSVWHPRWRRDGGEIVALTGSQCSLLGTRLGFFDGESLREIRVARSEVTTWRPEWSPEGDRVVLSAHGGLWMYTLAADTFEKLVDMPELTLQANIWSPDGSWILTQADGSQQRLYLIDPKKRTSTPITPDSLTVTLAAWSPDGGAIAFWASHSGRFDIFRIRLSDLNVVALTNSGDVNTGPSWAADGVSILFSNTAGDILSIPDGGSQPRLVIGDDRFLLHPAPRAGGNPYFGVSGAR
jgi:WD40 repeat protein